MACVLVPSVTLYGTTQVSSVRTITHTQISSYLGEPAITLQTLTTTTCDPLGQNCHPETTTSLVTITPTVTTTIYSTETKSGLVTNVVPQQTLYYPCSTTAGPEPAPGPASIQGPEGQGVTQAQTQTKKGEGEDAGGGSEIANVFSETSRVPTLSDAAFVPATTSLTVSPSRVISSSSATSSLVSSGVSAPSDAAVASSRIDKVPQPTDSSTLHDAPFASASPANPSGTLSSASSDPTSTTSKAPLIAGATIGSLAALILFCVLLAYCRRTRDREPGDRSTRSIRGRSTAKSLGTIDYWERRFRELETDEKPPIDSGDADSPTSPPGNTSSGGKKLRLTLDLQSKGMSNRPASRLSAISAFFSSKPIAEGSSTATATPAPVPFIAKGKSGLNFSRPRFGKRNSTISGVSRVSGRSGKLGKSGGESNESRGSRRSIKSVSNWLSFGAAPLTPSRLGMGGIGGAHDRSGNAENVRRGMEWMRSTDVLDIPAEKERSEYITTERSSPSPVGREKEDDKSNTLERIVSAEDNGGYPSSNLLKRWSAAELSPLTPVTPILAVTPTLARATSSTGSPSTPSLLPTHNPLSNQSQSNSPPTPPQLGRQLTPPKRSTFGTSPIPPPTTTAPPPSSFNPTTLLGKTSFASLAPTTHSVASVYSNPSTEASFFAPAPTDSYFAPATEPGITDTAPAPTEPVNPFDTTSNSSSTASSPGSSTLAAPKSFAAHRRQPSTSRKNAPELLLSRDAITPSLWIDEEIYDQFRLGHPDVSDGPIPPAPAVSHATEQRPVDQKSYRLDQSRFSPDSSVPSTLASALPTATTSEDPYGGITTSPAVYPQPTAGTNTTRKDNHAHGSRAHADQSSSKALPPPPSAALSLAESASTFDMDETASASLGTAWRASPFGDPTSTSSRARDEVDGRDVGRYSDEGRSAVTPQLPVFQLGGSPLGTGMGLGLGEVDLGREERMRTMYHIE